MLSAVSAALQYGLGVKRAMRDDLRGATGASDGSGWGGAVVVGARMGTGGGAGIGIGGGVCTCGDDVGGKLLRVCRGWMRGAVRVMWGAVGLDDVGLIMSPFEVPQGIVVGSYVGLFVGAVCVILRMLCVIVMNRRRRRALGRCSMHRINSWATCCVCSVGERLGSWQCTGYNSNEPEMRMARVSGT
jgi:hypothetical protein